MDTKNEELVAQQDDESVQNNDVSGDEEGKTPGEQEDGKNPGEQEDGKNPGEQEDGKTSGEQEDGKNSREQEDGNDCTESADQDQVPFLVVHTLVSLILLSWVPV